MTSRITGAGSTRHAIEPVAHVEPFSTFVPSRKDGFRSFVEQQRGPPPPQPQAAAPQAEPPPAPAAVQTVRREHVTEDGRVEVEVVTFKDKGGGYEVAPG